jgi:hypothetical protein
MPSSRLFFRAVCVLRGLVGTGIFILAAMHGGWYAFLGIAGLLIGLVTASLVVRRTRIARLAGKD